MELQAKRAPGSCGTEDGSQPTPPRCHCYDMCTALLFSFTTRALHLPGWPSLIKKLDLHAGDRPPPPLPVALTLHFLWARIRLSGVINDPRVGKTQIPTLHPKGGMSFPSLLLPNIINLSRRYSVLLGNNWNVLSVLLC